MKFRLVFLALVLAGLLPTASARPTEAEESAAPLVESIVVDSATLVSQVVYRRPAVWTAEVTITAHNITTQPLHFDPLMTFVIEDENGAKYAPRMPENATERQRADTLTASLVPFNPGVIREVTLYIEIPYGPQHFRLVSVDGTLVTDIVSEAIPTGDS